MKKLLVTAIVLAVMSTGALASLTWVSVDNSGALSGYVTQDMHFNTASDWLSAQLLIQLDSGSIFQDTLFGGHFTTNGPTPEQIGLP